MIILFKRYGGPHGDITKSLKPIKQCLENNWDIVYQQSTLEKEERS